MAQNKKAPSQKKKDEFTVPEIDPLFGFGDIAEGMVKALWGQKGGVKQIARGGKLLVGSFSGREKQRAEQAAYRRSTQQAFRFGREAYSGFDKSGKSIESQYVQNLQAQKARFAGSGARLEGSWGQVVGQTMAQRETAYTELGQSKAAFRKSEAGSYIDKAYASLGVQTGTGKMGSKSTFLGDRVEDYSGSSLFTRSQYTSIQRSKGIGNAEYADRVVPTFEEYQTLTFGSGGDKAALQTDITQRIEQANEWFAGENALNTLDEMSRGKASGGKSFADDRFWGRRGRNQNV